MAKVPKKRVQAFVPAGMLLALEAIAHERGWSLSEAIAYFVRLGMQYEAEL